MVRVINIDASNCLSESECDGIKGTYMGDNSYETIIDEDCDMYCEGVPIFKFRKNAFSEDLLTTAWDNCKYMAVASRGRGAAAGPIDKDSVYWKKREISWSSGWSARYMITDKKTGEKKESKMRVNNTTASSPIGYYGKQKNLGLDLPCRLSHYTRNNLDKYHNAIPFFQAISKHYEDLLPDHFNTQMERAKLNDYHIEGTPFSTITINRNFRTALHKDTGDFGGWACLSVLEENKYSGGLFVLPKFKVAINMRHGDLLVADVHQWHGNTELYETEEDKKYNDENPQQTYKDNLEVGVLGLNNRFSRISFVCYLREDMIKCPGYNKFVLSLENSERLPKWKNTEYKIFTGINGKKELSYECESCEKMVSYHNVRYTPQHLGKTGCFLSHMKLLKHIIEYKLNKVIIVEDDALQIRSLPESLPDTFCYLGGFIGNRKITSKEKIEIEHKEGLNTLDKKYRMICLLSYYIPRWEIAEEILQGIMKLKRWKAIDIVIPNLLPEINYIYPAVFIEEPYVSQIQNKKNKFANEKYELSSCKVQDKNK